MRKKQEIRYSSIAYALLNGFVTYWQHWLKYQNMYILLSSIHFVTAYFQVLPKNTKLILRIVIDTFYTRRLLFENNLLCITVATPAHICM